MNLLHVKRQELLGLPIGATPAHQLPLPVSTQLVSTKRTLGNDEVDPNKAQKTSDTPTALARGKNINETKIQEEKLKKCIKQKLADLQKEDEGDSSPQEDVQMGESVEESQPSGQLPDDDDDDLGGGGGKRKTRKRKTRKRKSRKRKTRKRKTRKRKLRKRKTRKRKPRKRNKRVKRRKKTRKRRR